MPARVSGVSAKYQRVLCREIKRARQLALLPYSAAALKEARYASHSSKMCRSWERLVRLST